MYFSVREKTTEFRRVAACRVDASRGVADA